MNLFRNITMILSACVMLSTASCEKPTFSDVQVTFDFNYEESLPITKIIKYGETVDAPQGFVREGYELLGWTKIRDSRDLFGFSTPIYSNTTLYASWSDSSDPNNWTNEVLDLMDDYLNQIIPYVEIGTSYSAVIVDNQDLGLSSLDIYSNHAVPLSYQKILSGFTDAGFLHFYGPQTDPTNRFTVTNLVYGKDKSDKVIGLDLLFGDYSYEHCVEPGNYVLFSFYHLDLEYPVNEINSLINSFLGFDYFDPHIITTPNIVSSDYDVIRFSGSPDGGACAVELYNLKTDALNDYTDSLVSLGFRSVKTISPYIMEFRYNYNGGAEDVAITIINDNPDSVFIVFHVAATMSWPYKILNDAFSPVVIPTPVGFSADAIHNTDYSSLTGEILINLIDVVNMTADLGQLDMAFTSEGWKKISSNPLEYHDSTDRIVLTIDTDIPSSKIFLTFRDTLFSPLTWEDVKSELSSSMIPILMEVVNFSDFPEPSDENLLAFGFTAPDADYPDSAEIILIGTTFEYEAIYQQSLLSAGFNIVGTTSDNKLIFVNPSSKYSVIMRFGGGGVRIEVSSVPSSSETWNSALNQLHQDSPTLNLSFLPEPSDSFIGCFYQPAIPGIRLTALENGTYANNYKTALLNNGFTLISGTGTQDDPYYFYAPDGSYIVRCNQGLFPTTLWISFPVF